MNISYNRIGVSDGNLQLVASHLGNFGIGKFSLKFTVMSQISISTS